MERVKEKRRRPPCRGGFRPGLHSFQKYFRHWGSAHPHFLDLVRRIESGSAFIDQESGDPILAARLVDIGEDNEDIRDRSIGAEDLASIKNVIVTLLCRRGRERKGVRAAVRFTHGIAADERSVAETGQIFSLLRLGAVKDHRNNRSPHVGIDGEEEAVVFAGVTQSLQSGDGGQGDPDQVRHTLSG